LLDCRVEIHLAWAELAAQRGLRTPWRQSVDSAQSLCEKNELHRMLMHCELERSRLELACGDKAAAKRTLLAVAKRISETGYLRRKDAALAVADECGCRPQVEELIDGS
jgi:hypothetical protein